MKIAVLGAGAIGSLIGGMLKKSGEEVYLVNIHPEHVEAINQRGLLISQAGKDDEKIAIPATTDPGSVGVVDIVILMIKTQDTVAALKRALSLIGPQTLVVTLQNGLGNPEKIAGFVNRDNIIAGTTTMSAIKKAPGHVVNEFPGGAVHSIKKWVGQNNEAVQKIAKVFSDAGMRTEVLDDLDQFLWKKIAIVGGFSALVGITRLKIGDLLSVEEGEWLIRRVIREIVEIANKKGIKLNLEEEHERAMSYFKSIKGHVSSLCLDVLNGRTTEIDSLNGAIAAEAQALGLEAPYNKTLANLVKIIEKTYDKRL
ncbi:ketopantoate reductase family protein [Chloroflexota bacterium]